MSSRLFGIMSVGSQLNFRNQVDDAVALWEMSEERFFEVCYKIVIKKFWRYGIEWLLHKVIFLNHPTIGDDQEVYGEVTLSLKSYLCEGAAKMSRLFVMQLC